MRLKISQACNFLVIFLAFWSVVGLIMAKWMPKFGYIARLVFGMSSLVSVLGVLLVTARHNSLWIGIRVGFEDFSIF